MHPCPWFIVRSIGTALASVSLLGLSACRRQTDRSAGTQTTQTPQTGQVEPAASRTPSSLSPDTFPTFASFKPGSAVGLFARCRQGAL